MRTTAIAVSVLIVIVHVVWAVILVRGDTGVTIGIADQFAFVVIGFIFAGVLLTLLRIRVRVGQQGVELRGPLRVRTWGWDDVVTVTERALAAAFIGDGERAQLLADVRAGYAPLVG